MNAANIKKALEIRHKAHSDCAKQASYHCVVRGREAVEEIAELMGWNKKEIIKEVENQVDVAWVEEIANEIYEMSDKKTSLDGIREDVLKDKLGLAYEEFLGNELKYRLNEVKWDFINKHPDDPIAVEMKKNSEAWREYKRQREDELEELEE